MTLWDRLTGGLLIDIAAFYMLASIAFPLVQRLFGSAKVRQVLLWHNIYRVVFALFPWLLGLFFLTPYLIRLHGKAYRWFFALCVALGSAGAALVVWGIARYEVGFLDDGVLSFFFGFTLLAIASMDDYHKGGGDDGPEPSEPEGPTTGDSVDAWLRSLNKARIV